MIKQVKEFIDVFWKEKGPFKKVLDVGSLDVNGSVRQSITEGYEEYTGVDMRDGQGVDVVLNGHVLTSRWPDPQFDLITCCDTLEHDDQFWLTVEQMRAVLNPGGYLLIAVPSFFHDRHEHPSDYYRFLETVLQDVFFQGYEDAHVETLAWSKGADNQRPDEIIGYARKPL